MIVKNEERFLEQCLQSIAGVVDEINVVDTGSTDKTVEIAERFGARVIHREWRNDFAWARNEAVSMATKRWVMMLDADEELVPESRALLQTLRDVPAFLTGLWIRCFNLVDDYKGTGASSHALTRIFPNSPRLRYVSPIHEYVTTDGRDTGIDARYSPISIVHHGYLANVIEDRGKAARNLQMIQAAVDADPSSAFNWYNLGVTALIVKDGDLAIKALEKMVELVGDEHRAFVPVGLTQLADAYIDYRRDYDRAVELCESCLTKAPRYANAHFILGRAHMWAQRYELARAAFSSAIDDGEFDARQFVVDNEVSIWKAATEIGTTYSREGKYEQALEWYDRALSRRAGVQPVMTARARVLELLGRHDEARAMYREVWETFADDKSVVEYINILLRQNDYVAALEAIESSLPYVGKDSQVKLLVTAAKCAERTGTAPALVPQYLERARVLAPASALVLDVLERVYTAYGNGPALARLRAEELTAAPVEAEDFARRATRLLSMNDQAGARAAAEAGQRLGPDNPNVRVALAAVEAASGNLQASLAHLETFVEAEPELTSRADFLRSAVLCDLGRFADSLAAVERVLQRAPGHLDSIVQRARVLEKMGRPADAAAALRDVMRPGNQRVGVELAGILMRSGAYDEARRVADEALTGSGV